MRSNGGMMIGALALGAAVVTGACQAPNRPDPATSEAAAISQNLRDEISDVVLILLDQERQIAEGMADEDVQTAYRRTLMTEIARLKDNLVLAETPQGYITRVDPTRTPEMIARLVKAENLERRRAYELIAAETEIDIADIEKAAGAERIAAESAGRLVLSTTGEFLERN